MRPITSGVGSAPHRLAKILAKPLSSLLGTISSAHLKNSGDLLSRIKDLCIADKKLVSFDVKALFTNVPVDGALAAVERVLSNASDDDLPIPKRDFLTLVRLCVNFNSFIFDDKEFRQVSGLAMGSPLSAVLACLYMETMEEDHYKSILGEHNLWVRYVDDVLSCVPIDTNLTDLLRELNLVDPAIQFTVEEEENGRLPFLDTLLLRTGDSLKFTVYRKPTNRNDLIHYFSGHSQKVKSGVVIGFFLRALRICSQDLLQEEIDYITNTFLQLRYPLAKLISLRDKAKRIWSQSNTRVADVSERHAQNTLSVIAPYSPLTEQVQKLVGPALSIVAKGGQKIGGIFKRNKRESNRDSVVRDMLPTRVMVNDHEELPPAMFCEVCRHDLERE
ncbi:uncharacterized protein LOC122384400 [Amphibalanus amphitrite]|uniref:uncharacterized protein LOC122384400 n=1 Tax=Amphibalanus amphitrite TaxID=1232801 RepID=UPI001C8FB10E|nr:uncharacterized protein LOC122384400 [Amphibalanus amphitrite]